MKPLFPIRNPQEIRSPKSELVMGRAGWFSHLSHGQNVRLHFGFRPAFGLRISDFGFPLALAVGLTVVISARAQSNKPPGAQDYPAFSRFITDRNIFDPNRQPHYSSPTHVSTFHSRVKSAPDLQLVGTMNYEKGRFAFFNGNSSEFKQALPVSGQIADHTIVAITATEVVLESTNHDDPLRLKVGEGLRQENGKWVLSEGGSVAASASDSPPAASGEKASPAPASAGEANDVLKRLMQLREKENQ